MVVIALIASAAVAGLAVFAILYARASSETQRLKQDCERLTAERATLSGEVERLRPLESQLAAAEARAVTKGEELERVRSDHAGTQSALSDQGDQLTKISERLTELGTETKEAAKTGRDAADGSKRTEQLFLGWTKAISNPQSRGALGELAIERQLTDLGLVKGRDFVSQEPGNDGRRRDLVVRAGEARVVLDSKWTADPEIGELGDALGSGDAEALAEWGKRLRDRAKSLADRHYQRGQNSGPRLVLMYVPVEGAHEAIAAVKGFSLEKFSRESGVYVITPSQLGVTVSLIAELWRDARREEQLLEVAAELSGLGEATAVLVEDLDALGRCMATMVNHYNRIVGRLTSRGGLFQKSKAVWSHVGRRFKKDVLRGPDGEVLRLELPRGDAADHVEAWRSTEDAGNDEAQSA